MARALRLRPKAASDILVAARWYEDQRIGLGREFLAELAAVFGLVSESPASFTCVIGTTRRALLARFPYAVFFRERPTTVDVVAVMHTRRDPLRWQARESSPLYVALRRAA